MTNEIKFADTVILVDVASQIMVRWTRHTMGRRFATG